MINKPTNTKTPIIENKQIVNILRKAKKFNCYVLIDDFTHYDFVDRFRTIFEAKEIFKNTMIPITKKDKWISKFSSKKFNELSKWERGGDYIIFQII